MLVITLKENQAVKIGTTEIFIRRDERAGTSRGRQFRVYINAPPNILVERTDLFFSEKKSK